MAPPAQGAEEGDGSAAHPLRDLYKAVEAAAETSAAASSGGMTIYLEPGDYELTPSALTEPTCGNCQDPDEPVAATVGLRLRGRKVRLMGAPDHASVIHTRAGYGILVQDCRECRLQGLVLTGGERDTSGKATDAAVVAQRSSLTIEDCWIRDNIGDSTRVAKTVVGIIGIAGREGCNLEIRRNRITRNSWDGIALYRDARAVIEDNTIDGVDLAVGPRVGGGRGVGIGLTWNAQATVRGNRVTRYWKGIGLFVDAHATVEENVVEHVATWGLSLWNAGKGDPVGTFSFNAVDSTGACGVMLDCGGGADDGTDGGSGSAGRGTTSRGNRHGKASPRAAERNIGSLTDNAIARSGQNPKYDSGEPYCFQTAVASHSVPKGFQIAANLFYQNRESGGRPGSGDQELASFRRNLGRICSRLDRWDATRSSNFYRRYCSGEGR